MKTRLAMLGVLLSLTGLQAGACYSMEGPSVIGDINQEAAEGIMNSPPECARILDIDQLKTLGSTGSIFMNGLNFKGDKYLISGMLTNVESYYGGAYIMGFAKMIGGASYAWITGGRKIDDASGLSISCAYKYRTVAEKVKGVPHKTFTIIHKGEEAYTAPKISKEDYSRALAQFKLGLQASPAEVKKAFMRLAMKFHPDREGGDADEFKKYSNAFDLIKAFQEQNNIS